VAEREYVLSKQLLRSGTSIGANIEEGDAAQTKRDFIAKMSIASKEARETRYWLRLLKRSQLVPLNEYDARIEDCSELIRLLTAIVKTSQTGFMRSILLISFKPHLWF
jgi:four helix bundle protein